jgi:tyrosinase
MAGEFVRQDIWTLEQQQPRHPVTMVYGLAVREMRRRDAEDPTSWAYQTAVHWTDVRNPRPSGTSASTTPKGPWVSA